MRDGGVKAYNRQGGDDYQPSSGCAASGYAWSALLAKAQWNYHVSTALRGLTVQH